LSKGRVASGALLCAILFLGTCGVFGPNVQRVRFENLSGSPTEAVTISIGDVQRAAGSVPAGGHVDLWIVRSRPRDDDITVKMSSRARRCGYVGRFSMAHRVTYVGGEGDEAIRCRSFGLGPFLFPARSASKP